jgi:RNA polymerase sigma factor (sigma-70 family)
MSESNSPEAQTASRRSGAKNDADSDHDAEFRAFYHSTTKQLVAFLVIQGASLADAADITQDTMIKAYCRWPDIHHHRAWVYRVASRALIHLLLHSRDTPFDVVPEPSPLLRSTDIEHWERLHDIACAMAELPPRQRQVMAWALFDYTPAEIAEELHISAGAVRQNLMLARRTLHTHITRTGGIR